MHAEGCVDKQKAGKQQSNVVQLMINDNNLSAKVRKTCKMSHVIDIYKYIVSELPNIGPTYKKKAYLTMKGHIFIHLPGRRGTECG